MCVKGAAMRVLCVVVHDVAPATWARCRLLVDLLTEIGEFPLTLLAVPRYHGDARDRRFESWLVQRAARGDEIALHGYTHQDDGIPHGWIDALRRRRYTRGEGEFWALGADEARRRLMAGAHWLQSLGLPPTGFVAPAWLLGEGAWRALQHMPFGYTCTLRRFWLLPELLSLACRGQVYSTATPARRVLSVLWNETLLDAQRRAAVVRLELHPDDANHARVRRSWQRAAQLQLPTRRPCTLRGLAEILRDDPLRTAAPASRAM
jgi:predicted deacetylase